MKRSILWVLLIFTSPWWWLFLKYPESFKLDAAKIFSYKDQYFVDEINTYQGQSGNRWIINKYSWLIKEFSDRVLENGDPGMLFFTGDLDYKRSTRTFGAVLVSLLPAAVFGFVYSQKRKLWIISAVIFSFLMSGLMPQHYFIPPKIPIFILYAWFSANGLIYIQRNINLKIQGFYGAWVFYDMARFAHELVFHYLPQAPVV